MIENIPEINDIEVSEDYKQLWQDVSKPVQVQKAVNHGLSQEAAEKCFNQLVKRPYYLCEIAKLFNVKNIVEVGTAQGLQFFSFAHYLKQNNIDGHVWSADIIDVRNKEYAEKYKEYTTFSLGARVKLYTVLNKIDVKIDMFYIDASHDKGDVLTDVEWLKKFQGDNPVWVFDDYDERFGCYHDINQIIATNPQHKIYRVGNAASGSPNHQVLVLGQI